MEWVVSLCHYSEDRAFYALELPPLVIEALDVFDLFGYGIWHIWESVNLFEDFQVYGLAEIVNCGFHVKSAFCYGDLEVCHKVVHCSFSHPYCEQLLLCFLFHSFILKDFGKLC